MRRRQRKRWSSGGLPLAAAQHRRKRLVNRGGPGMVGGLWSRGTDVVGQAGAFRHIGEVVNCSLLAFRSVFVSADQAIAVADWGE